METRERTRVVVDETTIYEIDLDCMECGGEGDQKPSCRDKNRESRKEQYI